MKFRDVVIQTKVFFLLLFVLGCSKTIKLEDGSDVSWKHSYDEFKQRHFLKSSKIGFPGLMSDHAIYLQVSSVDGSDVVDCILRLRYRGPDWRFYEKVTFLVDRESTTIDSFDTDRDVLSGTRIVENVYLELDTVVLEKISLASEVKVRFTGNYSNDETLKSNHVDVFKQARKLLSSKEVFQQAVSRF